MFNFLAKRFVKDYKDYTDPNVRLNLISLSSIIAILINILLVISKLIIGFLSNSSAVINDAFNNLSDTVVSSMALIGSKISQKPADHEHPRGHGRSENIIALIVGILIMYVGFELFLNSLRSFNDENRPHLTLISIFVLALSIFTKVYIYFLNNKLYHKLDSELNFGVMADARNDILATTGIIISIFIQRFVNFNVDAVMGIILAGFVFKPGLDLFRETVNSLLGKRIDPEIEKKVGEIIMDSEFIRDYHSLNIHEYGKGILNGSVDVEIPSNLSLLTAHEIVTEIEVKIKEEVGIDLTIHIDPTYSIIIDDDIKRKINKLEKKTQDVYEDFKDK